MTKEFIKQAFSKDNLKRILAEVLEEQSEGRPRYTLLKGLTIDSAVERIRLAGFEEGKDYVSCSGVRVKFCKLVVEEWMPALYLGGKCVRTEGYYPIKNARLYSRASQFHPNSFEWDGHYANKGNSVERLESYLRRLLSYDYIVKDNTAIPIFI